MTAVLIAVAGRHGATAGIAEEIATVLRTELPGATIEVRDAADPGDLRCFDAVLVGSAIYVGRWLPAARRLVEDHRAQLAAVPLWMFSSGPLGDAGGCRPGHSSRAGGTADEGPGPKGPSHLSRAMLLLNLGDAAG